MDCRSRRNQSANVFQHGDFFSERVVSKKIKPVLAVPLHGWFSPELAFSYHNINRTKVISARGALILNTFDQLFTTCMSINHVLLIIAMQTMPLSDEGDSTGFENQESNRYSHSPTRWKVQQSHCCFWVLSAFASFSRHCISKSNNWCLVFAKMPADEVLGRGNQSVSSLQLKVSIELLKRRTIPKLFSLQPGGC